MINILVHRLSHISSQKVDLLQKNSRFSGSMKSDHNLVTHDEIG